VPKAPVNEDREFGRSEDEIRFAENRRIAPPASDAVLTHQRDEAQFGVAVAARADARHDFAALGLGENIRHCARLSSAFHRFDPIGMHVHQLVFRPRDPLCG